MEGEKKFEAVDERAYLLEVKALADDLDVVENDDLYTEISTAQHRYASAMREKYPERERYAGVPCKAYHVYIRSMGDAIPTEFPLDFPGDDAVLLFAHKLNTLAQTGDIGKIKELYTKG
jgi:hypothetical protein